jgi:hypothetical protein
MNMCLNKSATSAKEQGAIPSHLQLAGGMRLSKWIKTIGISKMTAWRWRKEGKLNVIWRYGIPWVTAETIRQFFTDDGTASRPTPGQSRRKRRGRVMTPSMTSHANLGSSESMFSD